MVMVNPTLYLMLGYPGAGKTTAAEAVAKLTGAVHLSSDKLRIAMFAKPEFSKTEHDAVYNTLDYLTQLLLKSGTSVVYDANLNRYQHRHDKYLICHKLEARAVLVWVKTEKEIAKKRAVHPERNHLVPRSEKPEAMFDRIAGILEPPHPEEPVIELDGTKLNEAYIRSKLA